MGVTVRPAVLETLGLVALVAGATCLVAAAWLLAGIPAALSLGGVIAIAGGYLAVRAAALSEGKST